MANSYNGPAATKMYFKKNGSANRLIEIVFNCDLNVYVKVSPKDYICVEIYKDTINIIKYLAELGLEEYKFPERNK